MAKNNLSIRKLLIFSSLAFLFSPLVVHAAWIHDDLTYPLAVQQHKVAIASVTPDTRKAPPAKICPIRAVSQQNHTTPTTKIFGWTRFFCGRLGELPPGIPFPI
ncbi:MAG: hypothetical protein QM537_05215 [Candidatus Symbiobacter sp.]|nr:hypothetical protein [Candidatus Symbiobacter sp.]